MILADENIDSDIVAELRSNSIEVDYIKESYLGSSDAQIIQMSKSTARLILTEDKDFGEWVFAHREDEISVILLRYRFPDKEQIKTKLLEILKTRGLELFGKFTTITPAKIRIRSLP